jgi:predicted protein tyrosine phosphatase
LNADHALRPKLAVGEMTVRIDLDRAATADLDRAATADLDRAATADLDLLAALVPFVRTQIEMTDLVRVEEERHRANAQTRTIVIRIVDLVSRLVARVQVRVIVPPMVAPTRVLHDH